MRLLLKIPPHLIRVATLPCKTSMSENKPHSQTNVAINDKPQLSVATYLRCGNVVKVLIVVFLQI